MTAMQRSVPPESEFQDKGHALGAGTLYNELAVLID